MASTRQLNQQFGGIVITVKGAHYLRLKGEIENTSAPDENDLLALSDEAMSSLVTLSKVH